MGVLRAPWLFSLTLNEKRNVFIFIVIFPSSDCTAVEHSAAHYKAEANSFVPGTKPDIKLQKFSVAGEKLSAGSCFLLCCF